MFIELLHYAMYALERVINNWPWIENEGSYLRVSTHLLISFMQIWYSCNQNIGEIFFYIECLLGHLNSI